MYSEQLEELIDAALADGELSAKEKMILFKRAQEEGIDLDEFEMVLDARVVKAQKNKLTSAAPETPQSNKVGEMKKCPACGAIYVPGTAVCPECGYAFSGTGPTRSSVLLYEKLQAFNQVNAKTEDTSFEEKEYKGIGHAIGSTIGGFYEDGIKQMFKRGERTVEQDLARRKFDLIQSFPVPNNREDLIDFLTSIQPKADPNAPKTGADKSFNIMNISLREFSENLGYAYWLLYSNCINKARISFANDPDFAPFFSFYDSKSVKEEKKGLFRGRK